MTRDEYIVSLMIYSIRAGSDFFELLRGRHIVECNCDWEDSPHWCMTDDIEETIEENEFWRTAS